jgi:hypothetical protein
MELDNYLRRIQTICYSFLINFFVTILSYGIICQIPFRVLDVCITLCIWFIYTGFIHILFFWTMRPSASSSYQLFQAIILVIFVVPAVVVFHLLSGGFTIRDFRTSVELVLCIVAAAEAPFLIYYLEKKLM